VRTMVRGVDGGSVVGVCVWVHVVGGTRGATVISRVSWQGVGACVNTKTHKPTTNIDIVGFVGVLASQDTP